MRIENFGMTVLKNADQMVGEGADRLFTSFEFEHASRNSHSIWPELVSLQGFGESQRILSGDTLSYDGGETPPRT